MALGPVYPTILKKMKWEQQGLPRVTEWKARGRYPSGRYWRHERRTRAGCVEAGADIVSVVTDITLNADPEARVRQWIEVTR